MGPVNTFPEHFSKLNMEIVIFSKQNIKLRVVPLPLSSSSETVNKPRRKNIPRELARLFSFRGFLSRHARPTISERRTTCNLTQEPSVINPVKFTISKNHLTVLTIKFYYF